MYYKKRTENHFGIDKVLDEIIEWANQDQTKKIISVAYAQTCGKDGWGTYDYAYVLYSY